MISPRIIVIAHNIRSLWNVGSIFRSSDCFGVEKIWLTGYTGTPPRKEITKTALGAEEWVPWEHADDPFALIRRLREDGWQIAALEVTESAIPIDSFVASGKLCLVLGHEVRGVTDDLLSLCDSVIRIPMLGRKESLNVAVATGIALYALRQSGCST